MPEGNIDMGSTIGSYAGLMLLISAYSSGIFTSTLSDNQIVAFILSVFLCFFSILDLKDYPPLHLFFYYNSLLECKTTLKAWDGVIDKRRAIFCEYNNTIPFTVYNLKSFKF
jgi:ABC-2 type transport system permease protein